MYSPLYWLSWNVHDCIVFKFTVIYLAGQEEGSLDYDDGIKITPFNMKEEMEEGHFDKDGMYIFNKDKVGFICEQSPKLKHFSNRISLIFINEKSLIHDYL